MGDVWPVGGARCQRRVRATSSLLLPRDDGSPSFARIQLPSLGAASHSEGCRSWRRRTVSRTCDEQQLDNSCGEQQQQQQQREGADGQKRSQLSHVSDGRTATVLLLSKSPSLSRRRWPSELSRCDLRRSDVSVRVWQRSGSARVRGKMTGPLSSVAVTEWAHRNFGTGFTQQTT